MGLADCIFVVPALFQLRAEQVSEVSCNTMCPEGRGCTHDFDCKEWNPEFLGVREFKEDSSYIEWQRSDKPDEGGDGFFDILLDYEDPVPAPAIEETAKFCKYAQLDDLKAREGMAGNKLAAWLDDRSRSGKFREYANPMTAAELYRLLGEKV